MDPSLKISIIVPVFNVETYIKRCLNSLSCQTYQNIEIILIDDGSVDSSGKICDEFASSDHRVISIHKKNEGVTKARIEAFKHSTGNYITFVDADDYVAEDYIEKLVEPIVKYGVDMVSCQNYYVFSENKITPCQRPIIGLFNKDQIIKILSENFLYDKKSGGAGLPIFLCTKLIKRDFVLDGISTGLDIWWGEDQISVFSILLNINSLYIMDDCLYYYIQHDNQATRIYKRKIWKNQLKLYNKYIDIDKDKLLRTQLPQRTWKFTFMANFYNKMPVSIKNYKEFKNELKVANLSDWKDLFSHSSLKLGWKTDFKFWLLKLKQYRLFYILFLKKVYEKNA